MRIAILASGSAGNAVVVESGGSSILIDCGITYRQVRLRMAAVGMAPEALAAVFVTHEHGDHLRGIEVFCRRHHVPVFATAGTASGMRGRPSSWCEAQAGREITVGDVVLHPFSTSHDARDPLAVVVANGRTRLGVLTDTGAVPEAAVEVLAGCHALLLECNHDPDMLATGPYPWHLKRRIASRLGHLSNEQSRDLLERVAGSELELAVAMHLSRENNVPHVAHQELARPVAGAGVRVEVADQDTPLLLEVGEPR